MGDADRLTGPGSFPVSWEPSVTGDRFPIRVNISHPLWQTFLESGSISPLHFFRAFLAPPTYFQSPTPWTQGNRRRVAQKVAELLDSFRPGGTYCYRPFYKGFKVYRNMPDDNNNDDNNNDDNNNNNTTNINYNATNQNDLENNNSASNNLAQNADNIAETEPGTGAHPRFTASESARRRLYVDLDRPRPFYGRSNPQHRPELTGIDDFYLVQDSVRHSDPRSLQECAKLRLIHHFGLEILNQYLSGDLLLDSVQELSPPPLIIRDKILTLSSDDFQEIIDNSGNEGVPRKVGTFKVRCIHDEQEYFATFFTSEMDKAVSNLWEEFSHYLRPYCHNSGQVLALAADPLTENVFLITKHNLNININNWKDTINTFHF